jgi:hypothetical protein
MSDETRPQTKSELLARMAEAGAALEQTLSQLSEAQLTSVDTQSGWAIKDHLAHLAAWEIGIAALLQRQPRWEAMGLDEATVASHETDDLNDIVYRQNKDRSLAEVRAYFHDAHQQMLAALDRLSDEDLLKTYSHYQPDEPGDDSGDPILNWIMGNTYEHYAEHQAWIEASL